VVCSPDLDGRLLMPSVDWIPPAPAGPAPERDPFLRPRTTEVETDHGLVHVVAVPANRLEELVPLLEGAEREEIASIGKLAQLVAFWCIVYRDGRRRFESDEDFEALGGLGLEVLRPVLEAAFVASGLAVSTLSDEEESEAPPSEIGRSA